MPRWILVLHPGALGDVLLAVPAIQSLKKKYPQHDVGLIAQADVARVLASCGEIDAWLSIEDAEVGDLFMGVIRQGSRVAAWIHHCDEAVLWIEDQGCVIEHTLLRDDVGKVTIRSPFHAGLIARHQADRFLETVGERPKIPPDPVFLMVPEKIRHVGRDVLRQYGLGTESPILMVHPGSGSEIKCAKPETIAAAVARVSSQGFRVVVLEGPADETPVAALRRFLSMEITVVRDVDLSAVAGLLSQVQLYVGHDSGITHLAALVGVETLAFFGPTDQERWGPRGRHVTIVRGSPCTCASWDAARLCQEKLCLSLPLSEIVDVVERLSEKAQSSFKNMARHTLSPPDPCDKVAR